MNNHSITINIDKDSPIPIYYQVASSIRERITNNEWEVNEKIPSENQLTEEYGISRVTLRKSLDALHAEGIIKKEQGRGVFVQKNPQPVLHDFSLPSTLSSRMQENGINITPLILSSHLSEPIPYINKILKLDDKEQLAYIKRVFIFNNKPIGLNRSWLANSKVPRITENLLIENRLSLTLANVYSLKPKSMENSIQAIIPDASDMKTLNINYLSPAMLIKSTSFLADQTPLEYSSTIWLGDRVKFNLSIANDDYL
ncbi:GntR family transcriptional regulator [Paenibacillus eucommiae]|uniref:DNA-binding GntR family transcriptional regulator n=1 Tax=Paenibacillus eucommiae TaxID=1355755 RepID=A0ABS4J9Y0_9BACL|nr:GntR family transcriptional regulator [Paenibacillus eucommiae]MBP1996647.1 DNA-binding GntR family transcriptional regulator [Paenibacillus eucommiae]